MTTDRGSLQGSLQKQNPYVDLINFHPAAGGRTHSYWRLSSLWESDVLLKRAEENRKLAHESGDKDYLQFLCDWLVREGFTLAETLSAETLSAGPLSADPLSADPLTEETLRQSLNQRTLIKVNIVMKPTPTKSEKSKRQKALKKVSQTELSVENPSHQRCLAYLGCTSPQFTGKILLSDCLRAIIKYIWDQHLQDKKDRQLFRLDDRLRSLLGAPETETHCNYYDYKDRLLETLRREI